MAEPAHASARPRHHEAPRVRKIPSHARDLTEGPLWHHLVALTLYTLAALALQEGCVTVDLALVHTFAPRTLGALEAVSPLMRLVGRLAVAFGLGCAVTVGHSFAARDGERLSGAVHTALALALIVGGLCTVAGLLGAEQLLQLAGIDPAAMAGALTLAYPLLASLVVSLVLHTSCALQRAVGDVHTPLAAMTAVFACNLALDALLVGGLHLGARAVMLASIAAQFVGCGLSLRVLSKAPRNWRLTIGRVRVVRPLALEMLGCAFPLVLQGVILALVDRVAPATVATFGPQMAGAWELASRVGEVVWLVASACTMASVVLAAQNFGAARYDRMQRALYTLLKMVILVVGCTEAALCLLALTCAPRLVSDASAVGLTVTVVVMTIPFYVLYACANSLAAIMRGAGDGMRLTLLTLVGTGAVQAALFLIVVPMHHSILAVMAVRPLAWGLTIIMLVVYYRHGSWLTRAMRRVRHLRARHLHAR